MRRHRGAERALPDALRQHEPEPDAEHAARERHDERLGEEQPADRGRRRAERAQERDLLRAVDDRGDHRAHHPQDRRRERGAGQEQHEQVQPPDEPALTALQRPDGAHGRARRRALELAGDRLRERSARPFLVGREVAPGVGHGRRLARQRERGDEHAIELRGASRPCREPLQRYIQLIVLEPARVEHARDGERRRRRGAQRIDRDRPARAHAEPRGERAAHERLGRRAGALVRQAALDAPPRRDRLHPEPRARARGARGPVGRAVKPRADDHDHAARHETAIAQFRRVGENVVAPAERRERPQRRIGNGAGLVERGGIGAADLERQVRPAGHEHEVRAIVARRVREAVAEHERDAAERDGHPHAHGDREHGHGEALGPAGNGAGQRAREHAPNAFPWPRCAARRSSSRRRRGGRRQPSRAPGWGCSRPSARATPR